jgi:hypothetical protein
MLVIGFLFLRFLRFCEMKTAHLLPNASATEVRLLSRERSTVPLT